MVWKRCLEVTLTRGRFRGGGYLTPAAVTLGAAVAGTATGAPPTLVEHADTVTAASAATAVVSVFLQVMRLSLPQRPDPPTLRRAARRP